MRFSVKKSIIIGQCAILIALIAQITIPLSIVPLTGQTFAVGLVATIFPPAMATMSIVIYLLLGVMGLPVFAGAHGGLSVLFGPTGGYLFGFILNAFITSWMIHSKKSEKISWLFLANTIGALFSLLVGMIGLKLYSNISFLKAFNVGVLPFLIPGLIKAFLAAWIGQKMMRILNKRTNWLD